MCRYSFRRYKQHYACLPCQVSFKGVTVCPFCQRPMTSMGLDFKAPRRRDDAQWEKVRRLAAEGVLYHSCGCGGPGKRPRTLAEVEPFLAERRRPTYMERGKYLLSRVKPRRLSR